MRLLLVLLGPWAACRDPKSPSGVPQPSPTSPSPGPTTDTGTLSTQPPLQACDLSGLPALQPAHTLPAGQALQGQAVGGELARLGYSVAIVVAPEGPGWLVVGAPGVPLPIGYTTYSSGTDPGKVPAEIWVFDAPLPQGAPDRSQARAVLQGSDTQLWFEGSALTVGELTGDGVADFVSAGEDLIPAPYHVVEMPVAPGEHLLDEVAYARLQAGVEGYGLGVASVGDWNLDGQPDLGVAGTGLIETSSLGGTYYYGAEVLRGPVQGEWVGYLPLDEAVAWFDAFEPDYGGPGDTGLFSALIADVTGDGAADLLVNDYLEGISPQGWGTESFSLFAGNVTGGFDHADARARLHLPCVPLARAPQSVGDLTGDGWDDVAIVGPAADVPDSDAQQGAIWILSRLHELAAAPPEQPVSVTAHSDALLLGHRGEYLADIAPVDVDGDGRQDLVVLTTEGLYLFRGPLQGALDLGAADLFVSGAGVQANGSLAAGDLDGDELPELVVGDPMYGGGQQGQLRIYAGQVLYEALTARP
jgi:hypothetical protein